MLLDERQQIAPHAGIGAEPVQQQKRRLAAAAGLDNIAALQAAAFS
jgi:hypothetical protein